MRVEWKLDPHAHHFPRSTMEGHDMFSLKEDKAQGWRAMAVFDDGRAEALLLIGRSTAQIRAGYVEAFQEILDDEEREHVESISMQRWNGAPDAGRWQHQTTLRIPGGVKLAKSA
jgi:hypothetical protein